MSFVVTEEKLCNLKPTADERLNTAIRAGRIDSVSKLRNFPDLDAALVRLMIGPIETNTAIEEYIPVDISVCESSACPAWQRMRVMSEFPDQIADVPADDSDSPFSAAMLLASIQKECASCCHKNVYVKKTYINPVHRYKLYNRARNRLARKKLHMTKLHIKLMLILQSWPSELINKASGDDGIIPDVYIPDLSSILHCNSDYLEDCLKDLGNMSILNLDRKAPHLYDVTIKDYYMKYKKAAAGGSGYVQISRSILLSLLNDSCITSLRGKLFQLLSCPSDAYITERPKAIHVNELRATLPSYVNYHAQYKKAFDNDLFTMKYDRRSKKLFYIARENFEPVPVQKRNIAEENITRLGSLLSRISPSFLVDANISENSNPEYRKLIDNVIGQNLKNLPENIREKRPFLNFFKDALQISIEYGFNNVFNAICQIEQMYRATGTHIKNAGALLRARCCYNLVHGIT